MDISEIRQLTSIRCFYPPAEITDDVLKFSKRLGTRKPTFVAVDPVPGAPLNDCVKIVSDRVADAGGEGVNGWVIWEWPTILLEAEFHSVWKRPDGKLIDLSPRKDGEMRIAFVPDPSIVWRERRIPNKQMPLRKLSEISDFIAAAKRKFVLLGDDIGEYDVTPEIMAVEMRMAQCIAALVKRTPMELVKKAREFAQLPAYEALGRQPRNA